ncbi:MAG: serine dehydratase beta chain, partial [Hyphomicrobium sp.]|uniref:serine dehydratase beta chain n=1 Tax=Hyphomicrobium sp. TaxID=82 RepID=UPI003D0B8678
MNYSVFEVFRIGIGPSSSHTVGPMSAVASFLDELQKQSAFDRVARVAVKLYGSLALTGVGHATDFAVIAGLIGNIPEDIDPEASRDQVAAVNRDKRLKLGGQREIAFAPETDLVLNKAEFLPEHPNGMIVEAFDEAGASLYKNAYFSIGGGAVLDRAALAASRAESCDAVPHRSVRYPFDSAEDLLAVCRATGLTIAELIMANEVSYQDEGATRAKLLKVWAVMRGCLERGLKTEGILPGGLNVRR